MALTSREIRIIAAATVIASVGGLIHPAAIHISLSRGIITWLITCMSSGLILGSIMSNRPLRLLRFSCVPAALLPIAYLLYVLVYWLMASVPDPDRVTLIPWEGGKFIDPLNPRVAAFLAV